MSAVTKFYKWLEDEQNAIATKKRGRKPSKRQYFTETTQRAIIAYNKEKNQTNKQEYKLWLWGFDITEKQLWTILSKAKTKAKEEEKKKSKESGVLQMKAIKVLGGGVTYGKRKKKVKKLEFDKATKTLLEV